MWSNRGVGQRKVNRKSRQANGNSAEIHITVTRKSGVSLHKVSRKLSESRRIVFGMSPISHRKVIGK